MRQLKRENCLGKTARSSWYASFSFFTLDIISLTHMHIYQECGHEPSILRSMIEDISHLDEEAAAVEMEIAKNSAAIAYGGTLLINFLVLRPSIDQPPARAAGIDTVSLLLPPS